MTDEKKTLVILAQPFQPDPASVGQHLTDVSVEMVRRGYKVVAYTSVRGYDDPSVRYRKREYFKSVEIRRLRFAGFGKKNLLYRSFGVASFILQSILRMLFMKNLDCVLFSTTPPMIGVAAVIAKKLRRVPIAYWAMDLNPDQLIMMGKLNENGPVARFLEVVNVLILRNSDSISTLDAYMAHRIGRRGESISKISIAPPWPHDNGLATPVDHTHNAFRRQHRIGRKLLIMYSGNHSFANPLTTLLEACVQFRDHDDVCFMFIGGGQGKAEVERYITDFDLHNALSLPYQPIEDLGRSLSAADVHVVTLGNGMVGVIHPCKIYGAMSVGRPILYIGPRPSHISDILENHSCGWHVNHGDVQGCIDVIDEIRKSNMETRKSMHVAARQFIRGTCTQSILCGNFCDTLESIFGHRIP